VNRATRRATNIEDEEQQNAERLPESLLEKGYNLNHTSHRQVLPVAFVEEGVYKNNIIPNLDQERTNTTALIIDPLIKKLKTSTTQLPDVTIPIHYRQVIIGV